MRNFLQLIAILLALVTGLPALSQTAYPGINAAARVVATELRVFAGCQLGRAPEVGIWPLKGDNLPISDASAVAFYETVFAALNATKPDCATFVDGAGGSGVIRYFILTGDGSEARQRVDAAFRDVEFILTLDIFDRGGRIQADLKLTNANGGTVAAPPAFDVSDDFVTTSCVTGAIPLNRAVRTAARTMLEKAPDLATVVDQGGRFADTDETPSFTSYFGRRMIDELTEHAADLLTGRSVRLADGDALGQPGAYAFSYRYWPCSDGSATEVSAKLRAADGKTASWRGKVRLDRVPGWIDVFPPTPEPESEAEPESDPEPETDPDPEPGSDPQPRPEPVPGSDPQPRPEPTLFWSLSFAPRTTNVGDVVSIVADIAAGCEPFFLDLTEAGAGQVVPIDVFEVDSRPDGGRHFRVDTSTPVGLRITDADTKGPHFVGYICTPDGAFPQTALLKEIHAGLLDGAMRRTDPDDGPVFWFERYVIR